MPTGPQQGLRDQVIIFTFAFIAGWCDVVAYTQLGGLFVANISGTVIITIAEFICAKPTGQFARLKCSVGFLIGTVIAGLTAFFLVARKWSRQSTVVVCLLAELLCILAVALLGTSFSLRRGQSAPFTWEAAVFGGVLAIAMGLQTSAGFRWRPDWPDTTLVFESLMGALMSGTELACTAIMGAASTRRLMFPAHPEKRAHHSDFALAYHGHIQPRRTRLRLAQSEEVRTHGRRAPLRQQPERTAATDAEAKRGIKLKLLRDIAPLGGFVAGVLLGAVAACLLGLPSLFFVVFVLACQIVFIRFGGGACDRAYRRAHGRTGGVAAAAAATSA